MERLTAEAIMVKHGVAFVSGTTPEHFIDAMQEYAAQEVEIAERRAFLAGYEIGFNDDDSTRNAVDKFEDYKSKREPKEK